MFNLIGQRLGQYEVLSVLGEGGMAVVYRARQPSIGRDVAIKVIKPGLASSGEFMTRFKREAQIMALLSHPHIRKVFDYGQHEEILYLVSELIEGRTLTELLEQGPLPVATTLHVLTQIASALDYAHTRGIIHRDLKPSNVLIDTIGNSFLTDFGLAKLVDDQLDLTEPSAAMGTPFYMSPEQWRGDEADANTDNYGLAVLLFEMLTGRVPFEGNTHYSLMRQHLYDTPPIVQTLRPDLPADLDTLFSRALAKDYQDRFQSAMEMADAFQSLLGQEPAHGNVAATPRNIPLNDDSDTPPHRLPKMDTGHARPADQPIDQTNEHQRLTRQTPITHPVINALPQDVSERYVGRSKQQADIIALLTAKTRLISIYGRNGIGKTALACKILSDLQSRAATIDGMVYLSSTNTGISLDRILIDFSRLLGQDASETVAALARNKQIAATRKAVILLEKLGSGNYVLLLDNLEALQDPTTGKLTDADLETFFEVALEQGGPLRILITSREPLSLPRALKTWERLIQLDEGLTNEESIALLRLFDPDGAAGLRDASNDKLQLVVTKTHGYPRALEAIAGLLLEDPLLSVENLVNDATLLDSEIIPVIVHDAIERLSPASVQIMQVLALLERPVSQAAIEFLLTPYIDTLTLRSTLTRVVRAYFVSFSKSTLMFSLHPMDRDYCYSRIPDGSPEDKSRLPLPYTRHALHYRAAEYYRQQRKSREESHAINDLEPQIAEAEHLMKAGDYEAATDLLLRYGDDYLHL